MRHVKLAAEHVPVLCDWARQEALSAPQLKEKLREALSIQVSTWVVQQALSRGGFVWKRIRHSLKKKRCDAAFGRAKSEIEELKAQAQRAELTLAFINEAGFAQIPPNRGAWTPAGECHAATAVRGKPLTVILDNASVHTAKAIGPMLEQLKQKGLTLCFLPPYSPELNRIEILWRKVKYEWLTFKTRDSKTRHTDLDDIFAKFGEHYQLTF